MSTLCLPLLFCIQLKPRERVREVHCFVMFIFNLNFMESYAFSSLSLKLLGTDFFHIRTDTVILFLSSLNHNDQYFSWNNTKDYITSFLASLHPTFLSFFSFLSLSLSQNICFPLGPHCLSAFSVAIRDYPNIIIYRKKLLQFLKLEKLRKQQLKISFLENELWNEAARASWDTLEEKKFLFFITKTFSTEFAASSPPAKFPFIIKWIHNSGNNFLIMNLWRKHLNHSTGL